MKDKNVLEREILNLTSLIKDPLYEVENDLYY